MITTIQCGCGAVRIELEGEPFISLYCHCDDCQAVHGGAYLPAAMYRTSQTRVVAGQPRLWRRKTTARGFCGDCGTRLFAEPAELDMRSIPASLLPPGLFRPTFHMQCRFAVAPVGDDLPHFQGEPPFFGGSDQRMRW
jgi:hypothetical protein